MACEIIQHVCKRAGERVAFPAFEFVHLFARRWEASQPFAAGVRIRPRDRAPTGLEYESSGGVTGGREPKRWPTTIGGTVQDGSITWTARAMSYDSLIYRISAVTFETPPGITFHDQGFIDEPGSQSVPMEVSGGTPGEVYEIIAKVQATTVGGSAPLHEAILEVTIEEE